LKSFFFFLEPAGIDYSICGLKMTENMECEGATNGAAETASLEECEALAKEANLMMFTYNADKGKCFGVTEETAAMCDASVIADEDEKWDLYEFWCSEGIVFEELCLGEKVKPGNEGADQLDAGVEFTENLKKRTCDKDVCTNVNNIGTIEECVVLAQEAGLEYFGYNKNKDKCWLCYDSVDAGYTECIVNHVKDNKSKVYFVDCNDVSYIGGDYLCSQNDYANMVPTMAEGQMKCAEASNGDSAPLTLAECNNFALDDGYSWFNYRSDQGLCWIPADGADEMSCWNVNTETGNAWDVYTVCGEIDESVTDEQMACVGMEDCYGEDCFVAWKSTEQSWKCDGITQAHKGVDFAYCVEYTMEMGLTFMNYRTSNGACGAISECAPTETGSEWQIFINCAMVEMYN
jgi:hypothetical protein